MRCAVLTVAAALAGGRLAAAGPPVVWVVGDSLTTRMAHWLAEDHRAWTVRDLGVGGERSDATRARLATLLAAGPAPDAAIIVSGTNDVVAGRLRHEAGYGPTTAAANVAAMAASLRAAGAVAVVALPVGAPPPAPGDPPQGRRELRTLRDGLAALRAALHPLRPRVDLRLTQHELFQDALHPTPAGAQIMARRAARALERSLGAERAGDRPGSAR